MPLPKLFGASWNQFIEEWCAGVPPSTDQATTESALNTLLLLWPEYVQKMINNSSKGLIFTAPAIHIGLILAACKSLQGFEKVLQRIKSDERSALSELIFAEKLIRIGLSPYLQPALDGKVPATKVIFEGKETFFEVIAPETSETIKGAILEMDEFAFEILNLNPTKRIEILLTQDITNENKKEVKHVLEQSKEPISNYNINDVAIVDIREEPFDLNISPQLQKKETDAVLGVARASYSTEQKSLAIVRLCITDSRAKRLLYAESHHFNKEHTNILVMDVSKVTGGMKKWMEIVERCLQPNQNRRFGAVIFFSEGFYVDKINIEQIWKQVTNEYAYNKVSPKLLEMIITD